MATNINEYKIWWIFFSETASLPTSRCDHFFSEDGNKPSSDEDNKSVSNTDRINNCRRFSILCLQCLLRLSSMQKWVVLDVAVWYYIVKKYNVTLYMCHLWTNNSRNCRFCKSWRRYISSKGRPRWRRVPRLLWQLLLQERGWPKTSTIMNSNVVTFRPWYVMNGCVLKSLWPCWRWFECIEAVVLFRCASIS